LALTRTATQRDSQIYELVPVVVAASELHEQAIISSGG
jgi:hypothetical protein